MPAERAQRIEQLYHDARKRDPDQRAAFLDEACAGDEGLHREVESLLAQDGRSGPMEQSALKTAAALPADSTMTLLAVGTQLGPYKIEARIGAGGMGQVYRATDTRLDRKVAVKISAQQFGARFEREARAISALNHPNICTLYDIGPNYLVMELVEGETLSDRLRKGPLPLGEAVKYVGQICDALDAAHKKGITHRDLKPLNIMVTKNGVKVLDFGLAKSQQDESLTASRVIMGTPAYMAPEQTEGKECDARTDIYALGLVLREVATGHRDGATSGLPPHLSNVIDRCLAKDPDDRWQSAHDIKLAIGQSSTFIPTDRPRSRPYWPLGAVVAVAALVAAVGWWRATWPAPLQPLMSLNLDLADETPLERAASGGMLALSPDGALLALTLRGADGKVRLHTRSLHQNQVTALAGTENASYPFFSPDGEWIGFSADGKLWKVSVGGGAKVYLCEAKNLRGASWGDDGNIIASLNNLAVLSRVPSGGGTPVPVTKLNTGETTHRWPHVLLGSQAVLFTASRLGTNFEEATIEVVSLKTGERKTVQHGGFSPRYVASPNGTGHLIYLHDTTLFAVPFDLDRLALAGVPTPILEDVGSTTAGGGDFAFAGAHSSPGTFVYIPGKAGGFFPLSWLHSDGKLQPLQARLGIYWTLRFSTDGRLAFSTPGVQGEDIWVKDLGRDAPSRLSFLDGQNRWPIWTPDGRNIIFQSANWAAPGLYWIRSDGTGEAQRLTDGELDEWPYSFSPDGKRVAFSANGNGGSPDIFTAPIEGDPSHPRLGERELFVGTPFVERYPALSPDGRWLAYQSNETRTPEIYVRPFPGPGRKWQISTEGGTFPVWSRDGREVLFEASDRRVMAVGYTANGDSFATGKTRVWSETRLMSNDRINYDLAPDGKRLAVLADPSTTERPPTHLTVLLSFSDELRRKAPRK
jgi:serine/threonine-protein kinase